MMPVNETRSRFVIEPLEPGFGYTLGNTLRRTLLSRIPGAAVSSIRMDDIYHEFTTVPGVKEDVVDIILNVKQLVVRMTDPEPLTLRLSATGPGTVTAADLEAPTGVEIVSKDLHLATLAEGVRLDDSLEAAIRAAIRSGATPRHVPAVICAVDDIPRTRSGKTVELAVREAICGRPIANIEALANPEALDCFRNRPELA